VVGIDAVASSVASLIVSAMALDDTTSSVASSHVVLIKLFLANELCIVKLIIIIHTIVSIDFFNFWLLSIKFFLRCFKVGIQTAFKPSAILFVRFTGTFSSLDGIHELVLGDFCDVKLSTIC
jgi:hypothetical protein